MIEPVRTDKPSDWHLERFIQFARGKVSLGEPMAHGRLVLHLSRFMDYEETIWRLGLYLNAWSVVSAEVIWEYWSLEAYDEDPQGFREWLKPHFAAGGIHTRKERRCVRTFGKFSETMASYRNWMKKDLPILLQNHRGDSHSDYDAWYSSLSNVKNFGRYILANALDAFRVGGYMTAHLYELGTIGNHQSPMRGLSLLRQEDQDKLLGEDGAKWLNSIGAEVRQEVLDRGRIDGEGDCLSWFAFAALLCEYRQYYEKSAEYVGNSHDEELSYLKSKYGDYWKERGFETNIWKSRSAIFPSECLGEVQGWDGLREDVADRLRTEGLVWNDLLHDYKATISSGRLVKRR